VTSPQADEPWNDRRDISKGSFIYTPKVNYLLKKVKRMINSFLRKLLLPVTEVPARTDAPCLSKEQPITDKSRVSREANSPCRGLEIGATKQKRLEIPCL
jgi:hypothetical protein